MQYTSCAYIHFEFVHIKSFDFLLCTKKCIYIYILTLATLATLTDYIQCLCSSPDFHSGLQSDVKLASVLQHQRMNETQPLMVHEGLSLNARQLFKASLNSVLQRTVPCLLTVLVCDQLTSLITQCTEEQDLLKKN